MKGLAASAAYFADVYNAHQTLSREQKAWTRSIAIAASDSDEAVTIRVDNGRISAVLNRSSEWDVLITADSATLRDILELRRSPNEPYIFGELTVQGSEADFLRLDYIATMLCPS
jgi:putative sterol carrier protein